MRVLVVEAIAPEGLAYLREHGVDVDELAKASPAELRARLPDYEGLITRSGTAVTAELLDHAPRLRIVGRAGGGFRDAPARGRRRHLPRAAHARDREHGGRARARPDEARGATRELRARRDRQRGRSPRGARVRARRRRRHRRLERRAARRRTPPAAHPAPRSEERRV